jgi:N-dimethylarginine dimethylaminohydrolase
VEISALKSRKETGGTQKLDHWGLDSEYGMLRDILVGDPEHLRMVNSNSVTQKWLESGQTFDVERAKSEHGEFIHALQQAGVTTHMIHPDSHLPFGAYTRDTSVMTPWGAIISQMQRPWRRGEIKYSIEFYLENNIPIYDMVTAGSFEGGDVHVIAPGILLLGYSGERTTLEGAQQVKGWFEAEGWEVRLHYQDTFFVHLDVMFATLTDRLAAVCKDTFDPGTLSWLEDKGFEFVDVSFRQVVDLGCNVVSLGGDRVLIPASNTELASACRAHGLEVFDPDLSMITNLGGGIHCLCQAINRDFVGG